MVKTTRTQKASVCLSLLLLSTAALAQPALPPMPDLPPIESLPPVAEAPQKESESLRDKSAAVAHPDWGAPAKPAEVGELPPLPPLPGGEPVPLPSAPAAAVEAKTAEVSPPALPPIDLPALSGDVPNYSADAPPPPPAPAEAANQPPPVPDLPAIPNIAPQAPEVASNVPAAPATENAPAQPLTVPELPDLPDFTAITEPEGNANPPAPPPAVTPPVETPPVAPPPQTAKAEEEKPKDNNDPLPDIADLLKDQPPSNNKETETAEKPADPAAEKTKENQEVIWPKSFKTQVLPMQIYRKQYAGENAHLPQAQYYQELEGHLFYTTASNNLNGMRALLNAGVPLQIRSAEGETLLSHALRHRAYDAARLLIALGANPNDANPDGSTPLHYAAMAGRADVIDALLRAGADPRTPDMNGISPLQVAQQRGDQQMMAQLNYSRFGHGDMQAVGYATYMR